MNQLELQETARHAKEAASLAATLEGFLDCSPRNDEMSYFPAVVQADVLISRLEKIAEDVDGPPFTSLDSSAWSDVVVLKGLANASAFLLETYDHNPQRAEESLSAVCWHLTEGTKALADEIARIAEAKAAA